VTDAIPRPDAPSDDARPSRLPVVVLAGGDAGDALARTVGAPAKALVPLKGRPLGAYVLDALRAAERVGAIHWVGPLDAAMRRRVDRVVPAGPRMVDSLALGVGAACGDDGDERLLVISADLPWLTGAAVDRFIEAAGRTHDVVYPVVTREVYERTFPGLPRTWVRLAGTEVTGGNLVSARADALRALLPWVDLATRDRKSPLRLAARLGPATLLSLLLGRASIPKLEARLSRLVGVSLHALPSDDPVLACDVDRPEQLPATLSLEPPAAAAGGARTARPS
jgi:molybdopterin-guanine dinucleotide biosynthesis protein A